MSEKKSFTQKEKLEHYTAIAEGSKPTKKNSKYTAEQQRSYARGQVSARQENRRIYAHSKATPEERRRYAEREKTMTQAYKNLKEARDNGWID